MRIDNRIVNYEIQRNHPQSTLEETEGIKGKQVSDGQKIEGKDAQDQDTIVHLSQASKEAQLIKEVISSEPDRIREDKVAELKEKIESGKYEIDHEAVADKLIDTFLSF